MPILEYACTACGHHFEFLKRSSSPAAVCPSCGGENLERLLSGFAVNSLELTKGRVKTERKKREQSKDTKERRMAELAYAKEHMNEH